MPFIADRNSFGFAFEDVVPGQVNRKEKHMIWMISSRSHFQLMCRRVLYCRLLALPTYCPAMLSSGKQNKTKQNKTKQNKTKENKNKAKHNKTKQKWNEMEWNEK